MQPQRDLLDRKRRAGSERAEKLGHAGDREEVARGFLSECREIERLAPFSSDAR